MPSTQSPGSPQEQQINDELSGSDNGGGGGGSRLMAILSAVVKGGSTGLAGVPAGGRPSFLGGLGNGARASQAAQATMQDIKFKDFDNQVRAANLHNQDVELQMRTQAQTDAHQKMQDDQQDWDSDHGIDYTPIPNTGDAATNHLQAQTSANGAAVIPTGTHLSADGNSINIPTDTQATRAGQMQKYNTFAPLYGLPSLPEGAQFVPPKLNDLLTHVQQGYGLDGHPVPHDKLPDAIASLQSQKDAFAKNANSTPAQLQAVDNTIGILRANLKALDDHAAGVKQQTKQAELDAENSPQSVSGAAAKTTAIAKAQQPFKEAQARMEQAVKDGDPATAGQMLASGDLAPSQIISTRNPAFAQQAFNAAKKSDPTYNPQRAESEFKVANSPTNLGFFGSAKSLTDPGGTLDQLAEAYKKLPNGQIPKLNTIADWKATASGSGSTAGFAQTALGVADDYAKVMGGGQGSDSAREEMLKSFAMASSPKQMESSIDAARGAVGSQMTSRIGSNKAMGRMYGDNLPQAAQYATSPGKPRMMSRDGGKSWQQALAQ
jgi:hypothetical protein